MNPPNHYHPMTDEQLAQWHQHTTRIEQLERELIAAQAAMLAAQVRADAERTEIRAELTRRADLVIELTMSSHTNRDRCRRLAREQVQILRALRTLVKAFDAPAVLAHQTEWPGEVFRAIEQAEEVLRLLDIPF